MPLFEGGATFDAHPDAVWKVWTDVARWPEWDVSKEIAQLDGPFEAGTRGWGRQRGKLGGSFPITEGDARGARGGARPGATGGVSARGRWVRSSSNTPSSRCPAGWSGWSRAPRYWAGPVRCCCCSRPGCAAIPPSRWMHCGGRQVSNDEARSEE